MQTRIKRPPLRQADIDGHYKVESKDGFTSISWSKEPLPSAPCPPPHPAIDWLEGVPGIILTVLVLAAFVGGMWALYALWGGGEVYRAVTSAGKG